MGKCASVQKTIEPPPPVSKSKKKPPTATSTPKNLRSPGLETSSLNTQQAIKIANSGRQPAVVKSRPAVAADHNRRSSKTFSRSTTLRPSSFKKPTEEASNAVISKIPPNPQVQKELIGFLKNHFLFNTFSEELVKSIFKEMRCLILEAGQIVYKQGNFGNTFYVIEKGKIDLQLDGNSCSTLAQKQCFGELGLIQDTPRANTTVAVEKTVLRAIDRVVYKQIISQANQARDEEGVGFLEVVPLLKPLSKAQLIQLCSLTTQKKYGFNEKIITEGEVGDSLFIVKEGVVNCSKNNVHVRDFQKGEFFGEQGLLYQGKRNATCTAAGKVSLLSISRKDLVNMLGQDLEAFLSRNTVRIAFHRNQYLKNLSDAQVDLIFGKMEIKNFNPSQVIIEKGVLKNANLVIVLKGVTVYGDSKFRLYDIIGDEEISLENCKRTLRNDLVAEQECTAAIISKVIFEEIIGGNLKIVSQKNGLINILKKVQLFKILPVGKLQGLVSVLCVEEFPPKTIVFNRGDAGEKFYIVKSGSIEIVKDGESIRKIEANGFFGERSILMDETRTASAVSVGNTSCWVLHRNTFNTLIDSKMQEELRKRIDMQNESISLNDLVYIKTMSKGKSGKSFLVFLKNTKNLFFLRTISRNAVSYYESYEKVMMEKNILKMTDHPFIAKLIRTYKDNIRLYFLMEHVKGQDLFEILSGWNRMGNENARFYAAGILIILEYLHGMNISYRDLKPENIIIDSDGYPKIADFSISKIIENRTYSIVGTPHYMAPEVIAGKGYSYSADYWSLGVMIYEFLFNSFPFSHNETDFYTIYRRILTDNLNYPAGSHAAKPLLDKLLSKDPGQRGNWRSIKENPWFIGMNWDLYVGKQINPPKIPTFENYTKEIEQLSMAKNELFIKISKEEMREEDSKKGRGPAGWDQDF